MIAFPVALLAPASALQAPAQPPEGPAASVEEEVVGNILAQPLGSGTVADLALPDDFLRRVADRIIRTSFAERYRLVVRDPSALEAPPADEHGGSQPPGPRAAAPGAGEAVPGPAEGARAQGGRSIATLALGVGALALVVFLAVRAARRPAS